MRKLPEYICSIISNVSGKSFVKMVIGWSKLDETKALIGKTV